jgi:hypothetical protein
MRQWSSKCLVAKAGLVCKLSTKCTVVAATNPKIKFDKDQSNLHPLRSLFDFWETHHGGLFPIAFRPVNTAIGSPLLNSISFSCCSTNRRTSGTAWWPHSFLMGCELLAQTTSCVGLLAHLFDNRYAPAWRWDRGRCVSCKPTFPRGFHVSAQALGLRRTGLGQLHQL